MNTNFKQLFSIFFLIVFIYSCKPDDDQLPTLKQQIGQMLLVGFRGTELTADNHIINDLQNYNLGGVILYEKDGPSQSRPRNIESPGQLRKLVADLKLYSTEKLLIAIDEEGGVVNRLKPSYGFPESVRAQYLGEINNEDSTRFYAGRIAATLADMGINLNFAPVVDLNVDEQSPAIGALGRSFSANASDVVFHARLFIDEHRKQNILTCCKHFPGHGSAAADSHLGFTDVTNTWSNSELEPYKELIESGDCKLVMSAHVFNQNLDADYPATLSKTILTDILRQQLGFDGVIVSDAMEMGAITENYGIKEAIEKSINAGCDILVFSNNIKEFNENVVSETIDLILELVDEGKISREQILESYQRIIKLKASI